MIFLDVQLSDGESLRIFDEIELNSYIIFVTAFDTYALDAFNLNSVAYLLKPFTIKETEKSLIQLDAFIYNTHGMNSLIRSLSEQGYQQRFLVKKGNTNYSLETGEIAYFFKVELLFLVDNNGSKYIFDATLEEIESKLEPDRFFRVNRQFILCYDAIETLTPASSNRLKVSLNPSFNKHVIVSQGKVSALKKLLAS